MNNIDIQLQRFGKNHIPFIQRIASNSLNTRMTNTPDPYPENGAEQYCAICEKNWKEGIAREYVILLENEVIGSCSIVHLKDDEKLIGYMIDKEQWNRGIGKIVVSMLVDILLTAFTSDYL